MTEWNSNEGQEVVKFSIDGKDMYMTAVDYNQHLLSGNVHPVIIGDKLYMVNDEDFQNLSTIENRMNDLGIKKLPKRKKVKR